MLGTFEQFWKACVHTLLSSRWWILFSPIFLYSDLPWILTASWQFTSLFQEKWLRRKARRASAKVWNCCIVPARHTGTSGHNFKRVPRAQKVVNVHRHFAYFWVKYLHQVKGEESLLFKRGCLLMFFSIIWVSILFLSHFLLVCLS